MPPKAPVFVQELLNQQPLTMNNSIQMEHTALSTSEIRILDFVEAEFVTPGRPMPNARLMVDVEISAQIYLSGAVLKHSAFKLALKYRETYQESNCLVSVDQARLIAVSRPFGRPRCARTGQIRQLLCKFPD